MGNLALDEVARREVGQGRRRHPRRRITSNPFTGRGCAVPEFERRRDASPRPRAEADREALARGAATCALDARAELRLGRVARDLTARISPAQAMGRSHDASERKTMPVAEIEPTI